MIRKATKSDIPELIPLLKELFSQEQEFNPNDELQQIGLAKIIENEKIGFILVYEKDNKVVGMVNILFTISTALGSQVALLEDMVIDKNYQKLGIGRNLVEEAIRLLKEMDIKRITLLTDQSNEQAIRFYTKLGFMPSTMLPFRLFL